MSDRPAVAVVVGDDTLVFRGYDDPAMIPCLEFFEGRPDPSDDGPCMGSPAHRDDGRLLMRLDGTTDSCINVVTPVRPGAFYLQLCEFHFYAKKVNGYSFEPDWVFFDRARDMDLIERDTPTRAKHWSAPVPASRPAPRLIVPAPALPQAPTALYRWWDYEDLLLYIGISDSLSGRTGSHVKASSWMGFAARSAITRYPTRGEAKAAETAAIKAEKPLFNFQHNSSPEDQLRLVEYLVKHGRADLLAPAVSRG